MWEPGADRLLRVTGLFDAATATLSLQHPAGKGVGPGTLFGQRGLGGASLTGTMTRDGIDVAWTATQDALVGQWIGQGALPRLRITRTPGGVDGYVSSWLGDDLPRSWSPLAVTVNPNNIVLDSGGGRAIVSRTGQGLSGTITTDADSKPWAATRLPDPLALV